MPSSYDCCRCSAAPVEGRLLFLIEDEGLPIELLRQIRPPYHVHVERGAFRNWNGKLMITRSGRGGETSGGPVPRRRRSAITNRDLQRDGGGDRRAIVRDIFARPSILALGAEVGVGS